MKQHTQNIILLLLLGLAFIIYYQLTLLLNGVNTVGSDAQYYFDFAKIETLREVFYDSLHKTNVAYPLLNWAFMHSFNSESKWIGLLFLKITNYLVMCINLTFIFNAYFSSTSPTECKRNKLLWLIIIALFPYVLYICSKNYREAYIVFAISFILIRAKQKYKLLTMRRLIGFVFCLLFRPFLVLLYIFSSIIAFMYKKAHIPIFKGRTLIPFILLVIIINCIIYILPYQSTKLKPFAATRIAQYGSDYEKTLLVAPRLAVNYSQAIAMNSKDIFIWYCKTLAYGLPRFVLEPSPLNFLRYQLEKTTVQGGVQTNSLDFWVVFIGSSLTYLIVFPYILISLFQLRKNVDVNTIVNITFATLLTVTYILAFAGASDLRTKFIIIYTWVLALYNPSSSQSPFLSLNSSKYLIALGLCFIVIISLPFV